MYNLNECCCVCLIKRKSLKKLFEKDENGVNNFHKLISIVPEMVRFP